MEMTRSRVLLLIFLVAATTLDGARAQSGSIFVYYPNSAAGIACSNATSGGNAPIAILDIPANTRFNLTGATGLASRESFYEYPTVLYTNCSNTGIFPQTACNIVAVCSRADACCSVNGIWANSTSALLKIIPKAAAAQNTPTKTSGTTTSNGTRPWIISPMATALVCLLGILSV